MTKRWFSDLYIKSVNHRFWNTLVLWQPYKSKACAVEKPAHQTSFIYASCVLGDCILTWQCFDLYGFHGNLSLIINSSMVVFDFLYRWKRSQESGKLQQYYNESCQVVSKSSWNHLVSPLSLSISRQLYWTQGSRLCSLVTSRKQQSCNCYMM